MTPGPLPASLPHWILELLSIGLGLGLFVFGHSYGGADLGGAGLVGIGVGGLIHDVGA